MPTPEVSTLVLRFRDLVTSPGGTIDEHQKVIDRRGFVWWGWWSKAGESIPDEVFRQLALQARSGEGLTVLLLDTGRLQLLSAHCKEMHWDPHHQPQSAVDATGDAEATPSYYKDRACLAWFKFDSINTDPLPEEHLRRYAYVAAPGLFVAGTSDYGIFDGKQVVSIGELFHQNRSVWFVRSYRSSDPSHEILLSQSRQIEPADFPRALIDSPSTHLLWVSDLHYSEGEHHAFPLSAGGGRRPLWVQLQQCLEKEGVRDLAGVIVSGDLTWKATSKEFEYARSFFSDATSWARLESYAFVMCPGNHDIAFSSDPANKGQRVDPAVPEGKARLAYEEFYQKLFFKRPNEFLSCGRRFLIGGAVPVEIACLNSNLLEQSKGLFQGQGFVGEDQLEDAAKQLGWGATEEAPRALRVVVLHHHLLPVTYRDLPEFGAQYSTALDAEAVVRWIVKHHVQVVLHGHMHQPFCARVLRPCPVEVRGNIDQWHEFAVVGMGSTGVELGHLGEKKANMFAVLTLRQESMQFRFYSIDAVNPSERLWSFELPYRA